ncbi:MAG: hypothetical protein HY072_08645 [Deltaproteobacteria bacterium]|nr:hypothetical protein [Deltaproteobacteria bacterium]
MKRINYLDLAVVALMVGSMFLGCSNEKIKNKSKESAARYWQDKAFPGKAYDVQVVEAEKTDDGMYRVKGIVDGETPEGYYSLAHERNRKIA